LVTGSVLKSALLNPGSGEKQLLPIASYLPIVRCPNRD
jgi:hypothetical protein